MMNDKHHQLTLTKSIDEDNDCFFQDIFDDVNRVESDHYIYFSVRFPCHQPVFRETVPSGTVHASRTLLEISSLCSKLLSLISEDAALILVSTRYTQRDVNHEMIVEVCWLAKSTVQSEAERLANSGANDFVCRLRQQDAATGSNHNGDIQFHCEPLLHECEIPLLEPPPKSLDLTSSFEGENGLQSKDAALSSFRCHGFVVVSSKPSIEKEHDVYGITISNIRNIVMPYIVHMLEKVDQVEQQSQHPRIKFREVMQRGNGRFDMNLSIKTCPTSCLLRELFATARRPFWLPLVRSILGENSRLIQMGVVVSRGGCNENDLGNSETATQQYWHADGPENLKPYQGLCVFIPLLPVLNDLTGYTSFWSGTHLQSQQAVLTHKQVTDTMPYFFKGAVCQQDDEQQSCNSNIDANETSSNGCATTTMKVLLYDYKVIHRGEANHMPHKGDLRPILYLVYGTNEFEERNFASTSIDSVISLQ